MTRRQYILISIVCITAILCFAIYSSFTIPSTKRAALKFVDATVKLGTFDETEELTSELQLQNQTLRSIRLCNVQSSCTCVRVGLESNSEIAALSTENIILILSGRADAASVIHQISNRTAEIVVTYTDSESGTERVATCRVEYQIRPLVALSTPIYNFGVISNLSVLPPFKFTTEFRPPVLETKLMPVPGWAAESTASSGCQFSHALNKTADLPLGTYQQRVLVTPFSSHGVLPGTQAITLTGFVSKDLVATPAHIEFGNHDVEYFSCCELNWHTI